MLFKIDLEYHLGLRAVKTAVAVFLCLSLDYFLLKTENVFFSAMTAVVCMQQTSEKSIKVGLNRFLGTLIGAVYGYIVLISYEHLLGEQIFIAVFITPVCLLGAIYLCNIIEHKEAVAICCIVFLSIVTNYQRTIDSTILYVLIRIFETTIGIVISVLVNSRFKGIDSTPQQTCSCQQRTSEQQEG